MRRFLGTAVEFAGQIIDFIGFFRAYARWQCEDDVKGLIGKKIGMTQVFTDEGNLVPVTVIDVSTCQVVGKRTPEKDQYSAVTLGFGEIREKILNKCERGFFKKNNAPYRRHLKEFRVTVEEATSFNVGDAVKADLFSKGQLVDVTGVTKGRGFSGVMRRWSFKGSQTKTHGTHEYQRHPGAIGQRKTPGRTYPNKKMPGHYGVEQVTTQNLTVVDVDLEKGLVLVKGAVPGHNNAIVYVRPSIKVAMREQHKAARRA
ncbi:50S ribosomal protein L3 [Myxococcus fulvus]|uniref:Large ribosomal subunit protein uL3 n=1 Tax=Myxococcus fulvus TaxID=33 RepID=A0A511TE07_MYXFU|nr:50S ribosomal protein L3 [Myxococcus fulvus]